MFLFDQLHQEWKVVFKNLEPEINRIDSLLDSQSVTPVYSNIMRVFSQPISRIKVVIVGQDPYPGVGQAQGLAFSVSSDLLPASLKNIFRELGDDLKLAERINGDLNDWAQQGVFLLNRVLTTTPGESLAHADYGWQKITSEAAQVLGKRKSVAILWGKTAQELKIHFDSALTIESAHPSPLSAYRGFFGSKPFSRTNALLISRGLTPIIWA